MSEQYDVIIVGPGAGGGTLAHPLAGTGQRVLLLERGPSGRIVSRVQVSRDGSQEFSEADIVVLLDVDCKAREADNLYVVDTSFFPSIGAVNPAFTAVANAIGEHLRSRMAPAC
jgi:choline dehydrogenase-like flavoprotein